METNTINQEAINPIESVSNQDQLPLSPDKNKFKILFFIFLGLFLVILVVMVYFLIKINSQNKNLQSTSQITETNISTPTETPTVIPTPESISPTNTPDSTKDWKTYTDKTTSLIFKYPNDIPIYSFPSVDYTNKSESYITTQIYELSSLDNTEAETSYKNSIEKGQLPKNAPIGAKIIKLNNSKYAMTYMTLSAFEECDVRLSRGISFYTNKYKVFIDYQYNHNRSVIPTKYLTTNDVCEQEKVWKDRNIVISDFNNKTFSDKTIQTWFDTFDQIIKTINF